MAKFELFKDVRGEFRWRLRSGNGEIIASSGEGFKARAGAENGIEAVKRDAASAPTVDHTDMPAGVKSSTAKKKMPSSAVRPM
ncbi:uncharacterized protein YegP (UPF0339 family) [Allocatelliglobosispora scoriae]|uniref:Uncharacterized protein YegP (UPF0339 family) n=1 Tax=Allocatelliglobosispora scoriae TaxID=643052 RepID=A0A841BTM5_9ACTN|nr:DUF1508 domain-containing protein [Allocatelliglobosispora scoriae]MBB5870130.1 uncharacterized protein YegP (UPF0339 family) [Allocatelliglobosispora scoriae]